MKGASLQRRAPERASCQHARTGVPSAVAEAIGMQRCERCGEIYVKDHSDRTCELERSKRQRLEAEQRQKALAYAPRLDPPGHVNQAPSSPSRGKPLMIVGAVSVVLVLAVIVVAMSSSGTTPPARSTVPTVPSGFNIKPRK